MQIAKENKYAVAIQQGTEMAPYNKDTKSDGNLYGILDSEQMKAIASPLPTVVAGAAGTGKSTTVLHRIEKAIRYEDMCLSNIFVCSPTTKTAQKMRHNLSRLTDGGAE